LLTQNRMGIVKGDPSYSARPDAVPQTGVVTSGYAQATSAVASGCPAPASSGAVTSAQPAASQGTAAAPSNVASVAPGGGAVLLGESALSGAAYTSASTSAGVPAAAPSVPASLPVADPPVANPSAANPPAVNPPAASVVVPANGGTAEEMSGGSSVPVPAPAPTQEAIPPKGCGRNGKKGPYRSAM
jgi:ribonuclease E